PPRRGGASRSPPPARLLPRRPTTHDGGGPPPRYRNRGPSRIHPGRRLRYWRTYFSHLSPACRRGRPLYCACKGPPYAGSRDWRSVRASGPALAALLAALVLAPSSLPAGREADAVPPRPTPAFFSATDPDHLLLVRVYANAARDDEFVEIGNPRPEPVDMSGWSLTDGEATATFPLDSILPGGGRLLVARNATSYAEDTLGVADFAFEAGAARRMEWPVPLPADAVDEVLIRD